MNRRTFLSAAVLTALASGLAPAAAAPRRAATAAPDSRAVALLSKMTVAQKESLIRCDFAALSSLGIPALTMVDASAGLRGETGVTAFPVPLAQAATFDTELAGQLGQALGSEGRAKGYNNLLGPTVDTSRTWHFGRQAESMGEDPYLSGTLGTALTRRIQEQHVVATLKHFSAYTQEVNRFFVDAQISDRALHEIYHAAFERIITSVPVTSVMMAYPKINGSFATQSPALFNDLKQTIGLQGYTVPDFWAGDDPVGAVKAGMDLGGLGPGGVKIPAGGLTDGSVSASRLDDAALRILNTMFANGLFDHPLPAPAANVSTQEHKDLAHNLAVNSTVLLTNRSQALPLTSAVKALAVIGAADTTALTGVSGSTYVNPGTWTTPLAAIKNRAGTGVTVTYRPGSVGDLPLTPVPATVLRTLRCSRTDRRLLCRSPAVRLSRRHPGQCRYRLHQCPRGGTPCGLVGSLERHPHTGQHGSAPLLAAALRHRQAHHQRQDGDFGLASQPSVLPRTVRLSAPRHHRPHSRTGGEHQRRIHQQHRRHRHQRPHPRLAAEVPHTGRSRRGKHQ